MIIVYVLEIHVNGILNCMKHKRDEYPKGLHYLCRLIQADNKFKLEKTQWPVRRDVDVYFGITNSTTLNDSGKK